MNFLACNKSKKKNQNKFSVVQVFKSSMPSKAEQINQIQQINKFAQELSHTIVNLDKLKNLSWNGIPQCIRPKLWKFLLKYVTPNATSQLLTKKRSQYKNLIKNYEKQQYTQNENEKKILNTIKGDVIRIGVQFNAIFKQQIIQKMLRRLLYIWHMRHPASGYVQGMCDLTNPFIIVFLSEYLPLNKNSLKFEYGIQKLQEETLIAIEADTYWSISKMLQSVQTNYTQGFGGIHQAYSKVQQILMIIDPQLFQHFKMEKIDLFSLSFRSISTMLLRCFQPMVGIRLFDTYISYESQYPTLIIFLFIAILEKFARKMMVMRFDELMGFLHKMPTKQWGQADLQILIAQAYVYKQLFSVKQ